MIDFENAFDHFDGDYMQKMETKTFSSREELCETLDSIVVEFFDTLTQLYRQQELLAEAMKSGFLNLSRARYSMGVKTVNIDQVDETKMDAHVKIRIPETEKLDCDTDIFSLIQCSNMDEDGTKTTCKDTEKDVNQSGLRKRNVKSENPSKEDHIEEVIKTDADKNTKANENNGENELEKKRLFDPIKWFGVLVPGSLKQSQVEFRKCIEVAVNVGNLQTKLENFRKNYRTLLKLKKNKFSETEDQL